MRVRSNNVPLLKSSRLRPGYEKVYVPGELEHKACQENSTGGIPVPSNVLKEFRTLAEKYDVDWAA